MRLVEVIPGLKTAPWVTGAMMALGRRMTREPVLCTDSPAFLVNHVGRAFVPESQRILTDNIAPAAEIDRILTGAPGFKLGPFALADLVGIDVQHGVMESIYALFYNEPAFAPFPLSAQRVAGGLHGRKTGAAGAPIRDGGGGQADRRGADRADADRLGPHHGGSGPEARGAPHRRRRCAVRHEGP